MGDQCCSGDGPLMYCGVGRSILQPDWGWTTPCHRPGLMHLRRDVNGKPECYPICWHHMDELDRRGQLASSDGGEHG